MSQKQQKIENSLTIPLKNNTNLPSSEASIFTQSAKFFACGFKGIEDSSKQFL